MITTQEWIQLSELIDRKLAPLKEELHQVKLCQENKILPCLQNIEACYVSTQVETR